MDDDLIDDETLAPPRKSLLPGEGFFVPDSLDEEQADAEAREALAGADVAVVADTDADGLGCVALVREAHGEAALVDSSPHDLDEDLERVAEFGEDDLLVYVCDLCPDDFDAVADPLAGVVERASAVHWYDHHQWADATARGVRDAGVDLVVGDGEEECTVDVALRSIEYDFPERFADLAVVTRDHDLWIKEDERSDDLADFAYWADHEEYLDTVVEHGVDFPEAVREFLAERRVEKEDLIERAAQRAEFHDVGDYTVGVTYGRCSQNEVAESMRERGADASVVVKPAGSASIRGTDAFDRCHEVARRVRGGGHPKAAGCKPDLYDDMLDYAHHWTTRGATAKWAILAAFEAVVAEEAAAEDEGIESER